MDWRTDIFNKLGVSAPATGGMASPRSVGALPPGQFATPTGFQEAKAAARAGKKGGGGGGGQGFLMNPALNPVAGIYNPGGWCK